MGIRSRLGRIGAVGALLITGTVVGAVTQHLASAELSSGDRLVYRPFDKPCRLMDTRPAFQVGPRGTPLGAEEAITVAARGAVGECNIPADAEALTINVTWVGPTGESFLTFWPEGARPLAATANPLDGHGPTPNETTVGLSGTGSFRIYNDANKVDLVLDVAGFWANHNHDDRYYTTGQVDDAITSHKHDDRYYTQAVIDNKLSDIAAQGPDQGDPCEIMGRAGTIVEGHNGAGEVSQKCFRNLVTTEAGFGVPGDFDGHVVNARFADPYDVAVTPTGTVIVADFGNQAVRRIDDHIVTPIGSGGFDRPAAVAVDGNGTIYVADSAAHLIVVISPSGVISTLAGSTQGDQEGTGAAAQFNRPLGIAVADDGTVYVADAANHKIRKITPAGVVTTLAGSTAGSADGTGAAAQFNLPHGIEVGPDGNIYVADLLNHRIRKITPAGVVTTLAGSTAGSADGTGAAARFDSPHGLGIGPDGTIYVGDSENHRIRAVTPAGVVTTLAGSVESFANGPGPDATFARPRGLDVGPDGTIHVADQQNHVIRRID